MRKVAQRREIPVVSIMVMFSSSLALLIFRLTFPKNWYTNKTSCVTNLAVLSNMQMNGVPHEDDKQQERAIVHSDGQNPPVQMQSMLLMNKGKESTSRTQKSNSLANVPQVLAPYLLREEPQESIKEPSSAGSNSPACDAYLGKRQILR
jgi:hypothetical protein